VKNGAHHSVPASYGETVNEIEREEYVRLRLTPKPGDLLYLHLSDLLLALKSSASDASIKVLDFGAGGSPYRSLFPNADYHRADIPSVEALDYVVDEDGRISAHTGEYDLVLSTQVAEHVPSPTAYFRECHRVLNAGGVLILSTHGIFEEHGCPHDYHRWTLNGLKHDVASAGFDVVKAAKLTSGARCGAFLLDAGSMRAKPHDVLTALLAVQRGIQKLFRPLLHRWLDTSIPNLRVVTDDRDDIDRHSWYVGVFIVAHKRAG
jgi:SAM-dependent methyltransferase